MPIKPDIFVLALVDNDKPIVPQAWLGADVKYRTSGGNPLTAAKYQRFNPPTLAIIRHAFFDKKSDDYWASEAYRQSVLSNRLCGEWTSTFLRGGTECVEIPERVYFNKKHGLWIAEGGKVSRLELPPDGWALEYDKPTGFPSRTSFYREDAVKIFGNEASHFCYSRDGLRAVLRDFLLISGGPFAVDARYEPGEVMSYIGARSCRKQAHHKKVL